MTVTLELTPDLEATVKAQAQSEGITLEEYLPALIAFAAPLKRQTAEVTAGDPEAMIALLRSWRETEDPNEIAEQRETFAYLQSAIDEDRPGQRRVFGPGTNP